MKHFKIDQYWEFSFNTQRFDTGAATDADATPTYRVYESDTDSGVNETVVQNGDCAKTDDANTTGYYHCRAQATTAAGYEAGKTYEVRVAATVNSVAGAAVIGRFAVLPANVWDSLYGGTDTLDVQTTGIANDAITAAAIAAGAIDAATFAADVDAEARGWLGLATNNLDTQIGTLATSANLAVVAGYLDTEIAAILGYVDCLPATWVTVPTAAQNSTQVASDLATAHGSGSWATATGFSTHSAADVVTALGTGSTLTAVGVADKTGFKLASDGLDSVATTAPSGPAANFREMVVQTWRRFFRKSTRTYTGGTQQIVTYADNGTTPITTQTISDDATTETQGTAT